jgi:prepilin-type N-terminal cleavage/methylation domain-containing protein
MFTFKQKHLPYRIGADRGFTLIETVFAVLIAGIAALAFVAAAVYTNRQAQINRDHMYGLMIANRVAAQIMAADWERLGDPALATTGSLEQTLLAGTTNRDGDPFTPNVSPNFTITITYTGWGPVAAASGGASPSLRSGPTPGRRPWQPNEWQNQTVLIHEGAGRNTLMRVLSNTADTLRVTADLTTAGLTGTPTGWVIVPDTTSRYSINGGKFAEIVVTWVPPNSGIQTQGTEFRRIVRTVFIPRPVALST